MKKLILLPISLILSGIGISCGIFGSSDDECSCTEITYHYDENGVQFISGVRKISCSDELKTMSEMGKTKFKWFLKDGVKTRSEAINCSGSDEPRIVDCGVVEYKGEQFYVDCSEGISSFTYRVTRGTFSACFLLTCSRTRIPINTGTGVFEASYNCLETVKLCK